jgi:hypothetical protein
LRALPSFKEKDYERALIDVYLKMDSMIQTTYGKSKLQGYYAKGKGNTSEFDDGLTE